MLICHEICDGCYNCLHYGECVWNTEMGCSVRAESTSFPCESVEGFAVQGRITHNTDGSISIDVGDLHGDLTDENMEVLSRIVKQYDHMKSRRGH